MGAQTLAHRYTPTPTCGYPKSECYLWCQVTGKALGFLLFQAGFDRPWSKSICNHQESAHMASSACTWVQPRSSTVHIPYVNAEMQMVWHGLRSMWGPSGCSCGMDRWSTDKVQSVGRYLSLAFCSHDVSALSLGYSQSNHLQCRLGQIMFMIRPALHLAVCIDSSGSWYQGCKQA